MQPFDALTMRAVLQEARPLLQNRKVDKVYQLGRDEIILAMRTKAGAGHFLLSAQASFGRICLINAPALPKHVNPPAFCQLLRKHLSGGTLIDIQQIPGERVADLTFGCVDELGTRSTKVLTAEIMGRHSNLIFWDKDTGKIVGASHVVTAEMSRQREVAPNLPYARPPQQDKPSIFSVSQDAFIKFFSNPAPVPDGQTPPATLEQWLLMTFAGLGRHLADELIAAAELPPGQEPQSCGTDCQQKLWTKVAQLQTAAHYKPAMRLDLTRYTVLSWWPNMDQNASDWKHFPAVNDMIEDYFRTLQQREQMQQLRDRIRSELKTEAEKIDSRLTAANKQLESTDTLDQFRIFGDMILANLATIEPGQEALECDNLYSTDGNGKLSIALNPNLSGAQNAQHYYRQFAKARVRKQTASVAQTDATHRLTIIKDHMQSLDQAKTPEELQRLKELILDRGKRLEKSQPTRTTQRPQQQNAPAKTPRLMSTKSTDGWLIYIGRNRIENDVLISKLAQPQDLWLHVQGQEGAHVLIKNPNKQDPPHSTLREAAQLAARFSRISLGSKVRVIYTHCKYVKKIGKDKPGLVRYENEKTIEVDTAAPMPPSLRKLFAK